MSDNKKHITGYSEAPKHNTILPPPESNQASKVIYHDILSKFQDKSFHNNSFTWKNIKQ